MKLLALYHASIHVVIAREWSRLRLPARYRHRRDHRHRRTAPLRDPTTPTAGALQALPLFPRAASASKASAEVVLCLRDRRSVRMV